MPSVSSRTALQLPVIDLRATSKAPISRAASLNSIREACEDKGFFVLTNHGISTDFQTKMFQQAKYFFDLPLKQKLAVDESLSGRSHRGYQRIGGEGNEPGKLPDLKEGFQYGRDQPMSHRMLTGPNLWPSNEPVFRETLEQYFQGIRKLSIVVFKLIAGSLELDFDTSFRRFCSDEASAVRLLHYPPQSTDRNDEQLGTGAHTD